VQRISVQFVLTTNLTHFLVCLFHFCTCFEQPSAHHQESQLYQYIIWYVSLCVGGRLVCRSDLYTRRPPTTWCIDTIDSPDDEHWVARNMWRSEINTLKSALSWLLARNNTNCEIWGSDGCDCEVWCRTVWWGRTDDFCQQTHHHMNIRFRLEISFPENVSCATVCQQLIARTAQCWQCLLTVSADKCLLTSVCWQVSADSVCWQVPTDSVCWQCLLTVSADSVCWQVSADSVCWQCLLTSACWQCLLTVSADKCLLTSVCWQVSADSVCWQCLLTVSADKCLLTVSADKCLLTVPADRVCWQYSQFWY